MFGVGQAVMAYSEFGKDTEMMVQVSSWHASDRMLALVVCLKLVASADIVSCVGTYHKMNLWDCIQLGMQIDCRIAQALRMRERRFLFSNCKLGLWRSARFLWDSMTYPSQWSNHCNWSLTRR